ncbi:hypothetical protein [Haloferax sp. ATB1]|nr:hypothetical protein [Haloferax sp. ATB1]
MGRRARVAAALHIREYRLAGVLRGGHRAYVMVVVLMAIVLDARDTGRT